MKNLNRSEIYKYIDKKIAISKVETAFIPITNSKFKKIFTDVQEMSI